MKRVANPSNMRMNLVIDREVYFEKIKKQSLQFCSLNFLFAMNWYNYMHGLVLGLQLRLGIVQLPGLKLGDFMIPSVQYEPGNYLPFP